ncbi:uncharacterized protein LOC134311806 isoform X2 [Trichomycterus rosablanca]|uniref:uncharacterized protein LOC134311806 isoform X2 n=1 Tax=Trichomycterus rosablanca TaxID=2290929 RepID=UPI002F35EFB5
MDYKNNKSKERQSFSCGPKRRLKHERRQVQINIGLMVPHGCDLKPARGKTLPLFTDPEITAPDLLKLAVHKMRVFNKDMDEGPYVLLFPDCSEVVHVPGTERPFMLADYRKEIGKTYCRISFFLCQDKHFRGVDARSESDSDSEIVITTRSRTEFNQADTVVFKPQNQNTPKNKPEDEVDAMGHSSSTISAGQILISDSEDNLDPPGSNQAKSLCYSKYTDLYAPCVEDEEDEEPVPVNVQNIPDLTM